MLARLRRPRRRLIRLLGRWTVRLTVVTAFICCVVLVSPPQVWAVADIPTVIKNLRNWVVGMLSGLATLFPLSHGRRRPW